MYQPLGVQKNHAGKMVLWGATINRLIKELNLNLMYMLQIQNSIKFLNSERNELFQKPYIKLIKHNVMIIKGYDECMIKYCA